MANCSICGARLKGLTKIERERKERDHFYLFVVIAVIVASAQAAFRNVSGWVFLIAGILVYIAVRKGKPSSGKCQKCEASTSVQERS